MTMKPSNKRIDDLPHVTIPDDYPVGPFLAECYEKHGPIFTADGSGYRVIYMVGPEANRFMLLSSREAFSHDLGWTPMIGQMMGKGLINMDGPEHDSQRKMMNPAFATRYMDRYLPIMNRVIGARIADWGERGSVDLYDETRKITFDVAAEALVGFSAGPQVDRFRELFVTVLQGDPNAQSEEAWLAASLAARDTLMPLLQEQIEARRAEPTQDILGILVQARDDEGRALTDAQLLGHLNILLVAGHETSTSLSAWLLYLLSTHPEYLARVRTELDEVLGGSEPHLGAVKGMKVLGYALSEAERLYPPVANGPRGNTQAFTFHGYTIPAGQRVLYSIAASHLLPHIWRNPERFDPDRFAPPREEDKKHPYALVGFGGGPRVCIGMNFATVEIKAMAATILGRYDLTPEPGQEDRVRPVHRGMGNKMQVQVQER